MNFHTIKSVSPLENFIIEVLFNNGIYKRYDLKPLIQRFKAFDGLKNLEVFNGVKVDPGGYGIIWNEDLDLSSEEIWENGEIINK